MPDFVHKYVAGDNATAPTLLALHGTGGDEGDLLPLAEAVAPGSAILSPRGRVLEQGLPRFFRRISEGVFDLEDLARRTIELGDFIAMAARQYGFDPTRVVAVGYSNGANIAASLLLTRPEALAGAILFRPMVPFEPQGARDLGGKAILISAGQRDPIVPPASALRLGEILKAAGASVTTSWYDSGHALTPGEITAASAWFAREYGAAP
jgi:predicted esterase